MKFQIFASFIALAGSAMAEEVSQEFLEQPGVTWVATELPLSVQEGLTIAMVPYIRFEDGQVESGFFTGAPYFTSAACENYYECPDMTQEATVFLGSYSLEGNTVLSPDGVGGGDWLLDREEAHLLAMSADAMRGRSAILVREGDRFVQTRPEGPRTYVALPEDLYRAPVNLGFFAQESVALTYECSVETIAALAATPLPDRTEQQVQLAAYLRIAEAALSRDNARELLSPYWLTEPLSAEDQIRVDQLRYEMMVTSMFGLVHADLRDPGPGSDVSPETLEAANNMLTAMKDRASDPDAVQDLFDALYPDMVLAAPLAVELAQAQRAGVQGINDVFCPE